MPAIPVFPLYFVPGSILRILLQKNKNRGILKIRIFVIVETL